MEDITICKIDLTNIVDAKFQNRLTTLKGIEKMHDRIFDDIPTVLDFKSFIREIRTIIAHYNLEYKDIMSFLMGIIQKRLDKLLREFNSLYKKYSEASFSGDIDTLGMDLMNKYESGFIDFSRNLVESLFFLYLCDVRMSTSIKIVSIVNILQLFVRGNYIFEDNEKSKKFGDNYINELDKKISDETKFVMKNINCSETNQLELLNLLELQKKMYERNQVKSNVLETLLLRDNNLKVRLNYFSAFEIIHFTQFSKSFEKLNKHLYEWVDGEMDILSKKGESDTEAVLTFMEIMFCPFVDQNKKVEWMNKLGMSNNVKLLSFFQKKKNLFIKWKGYNLYEEMKNINCMEVY